MQQHDAPAEQCVCLGTCGKAPHCHAKALADRLYRAGVHALSTHGCVLVQQGIPGHLDMVEPDLAIVDSVQPHLGAIVQDLDPRRELAVVVTQAHYKDMGSLPLAIYSQLGEDCTYLQPTQLWLCPCAWGGESGGGAGGEGGRAQRVTGEMSQGSKPVMTNQMDCRECNESVLNPC